MGDFDPVEEEEHRLPGDGRVCRRALVIGIDAYRHLDRRMLACSQPAADLAALLRSRGYEVTALHDERGRATATLAAVERELAAIMKASDEDDTVLFYFGGHGVLVNDRPVLLMADARSRGGRFVEGTLPLARLLARLRGRPRWTVILLDACHMGLTLDPSFGRATAATSERLGGFALLSGSTQDDVTQDDYGGDGPAGGAFTKALIDGLSGAAADPDGGVRFSSLARHVQAWVETWRATPEARLIGARQTPVLRLEVADVQILPAHRYRDLTPSPGAKITCAAFSPDGRRLVTGGEDRTARIWDPLTGTQLHPPIVHDDDLQSVAISPAGDEAASVSYDGVTKVWTLTNGRVEKIPRGRRRGKVNGAAWAGAILCRAVVTTEGLYIDDLVDLFQPVGTRRLNRKRTCFWSVAFTRELWEVVTGDEDGNVTVWNTMVGAPSVVGKHEGPVWAVAAGPDPRYVAAGGTDKSTGPTLRNQPRIWDLESDNVTILPGHRSSVTGIAYSPDGERVATSCYDGVVRVFDLRGKLLQQLTVAVGGRLHRPEAYAVCFSPTDPLLFAGYSDGRGRLFKL